MTYRLRVDPRVSEAYPDYAALVIYARGLANGPSSEETLALLRAAEAAARTALAGSKPQEHPHIQAWRAAFGRFGAKPSRYPCSAEALLARALRDGLPSINDVTDRYNAVSVRHILPAGGEDLDALASDLVLTFATGEEPFDTFAGGAVVIDHPEPGEVVWADREGVTCRRWNWRQGYRTRLREETRNAYFILDRLAPYPLAALTAAGDELVALLRATSPGCELEVEQFGPLTTD